MPNLPPQYTFEIMMKEGAPDIPLRPPTLLSMSAAVLAKRHTALMQSNPEADAATEVYADCPLPNGASHAVFDEHRKMWNAFNGVVARSLDATLKAFCNSSNFPLDNLNLTGATLNDEILAELLAQHCRISQLDLTDVKGISDQANVLLDSKNVQLPELATLRMSSMDLLRRPLPRRKNGVAIMNIPVLGEEDLITQGGGDRLDQMREARGGGPSQAQHLGIAQQANQQAYEMVFEQMPERPPERNGFISPYSPASEIWNPHLEDLPTIPPEEERELPVFTSRCPAVTSLLLPKLKRYPEEEEDSVNDFLIRVLEPLESLQKLDISYWSKVDDLRCLNSLNLTTLILYEVPDLYKAVDNIVMLKDLKYLDLSQSTKDTGIYPKPVTALHRIVTGLPCLEKLDLSSTNLASQPSINDWPVPPEDMSFARGTVKSDIVGLRFLTRKLKFLGLFNCDNASHFMEIPAEQISGDANEDQVITALQVYRERAGLLQSVLNESYQLYRFGNSAPLTRQAEALHLVLEAMQRHIEDSTLQIAGSASLFYIIRKVLMNRDTKKAVVQSLLSGMEHHREEQVMVRNCCLSLCQFEIPQEILFDYSRLAIILVSVLQHHNADQLTQRIVVFLLNSMACHVEGDQKLQIGGYGAIEMILEQIKRKLASNTCDDVMEVGWSFLWNITDETPPNCSRFLDAEGLTLFQKCYNTFHGEKELIRNCMGLVGNIAEVQNLRHRLMNADYIKIFTDLLETRIEESIEISYNSAGVLAHMVSDGEEAWNEISSDRREVMEKIIAATEKWDLKTRRFINYRSFRPILRLLPLWHAPASQHWAVWALANLTTTDGAKYCYYVTEEGGVPLLEDLVKDSQTNPATKELAGKVLENISKHSRSSTNETPMETDESQLVSTS